LALGACELAVRIFVPVRNVGPSFTVADPYYGKVLKRSFSARRITPEFTMRFTTNSDGFRGPELGSLSQRPILFLGDSFTEGYGVNDGEEFPALIRDALKAGAEAVPVINAGLGDNGNGRWVKFLRHRAAQYNPLLVVVQICENDQQDNLDEGLFTVSPNGQLIELPVPLPGMERWAGGLLDRVPVVANSYLVGLFREVSWRGILARRGSNLGSGPANDSHDPSGELLQSLLLDEMLRICAANGWPVLVIIGSIPNPQAAKLEEFFSKRGVRMVIIPTKEERPDLFYRVDGHWNAAGHRFVADRVLEAIRESNPAP
jgi:lysophospholipase L1-like esterase